MTLAKAKSITQLDIKVLVNGNHAIAKGHENSNGAVVAGVGTTIKDALSQLVENNWRRVRDIVRHRQQYRCAGCGKILPLQGHHIKRRSQGRLDTPDNVRCDCDACHREEEGHS